MKFRVIAGFAIAAALAASCASDDSTGSVATPTVAGSATTVSGAAPSTAPAEVKADPNATLVVGQIGNPLGQFNPKLGTSPTIDQVYMAPAYDQLIEIRADLSLKPMLATSWTVGADGTSLDVKLRQGVTFQDGTPFNADAVVENINASLKLDGKLAKSQLSLVTAIEKVDEFTVKFKTNGPATTLPFLLGHQLQCCAMVSPKALASPAGLATTPAGTGAYKLVSATTDRVVYEKADKYWDTEYFAKAPKRLELVGIVDDTARLNALLSGQIGVMAVTTPIPDITKFASSNKLDLTEYKRTARTFVALLNLSRPSLGNVEVRKALSLAVDRAELTKVLGDVCTPAVQPFGPGYVGYNEALDAKAKVYDSAQAKQILDKAGVTGLKLRVLTPETASFQAMAVAMQAQLTKIGVGLELVVKPTNQVAAEWATNNYDIYVAGGPGGPDPSIAVSELFGRLSPGGVPADFTKLADTAKNLPIASAERNTAYQAVAGYLADNPIHLFVCSFPLQVLSNKKVFGVDQNYLGTIGTPINARNLGIRAA